MAAAMLALLLGVSGCSSESPGRSSAPPTTAAVEPRGLPPSPRGGFDPAVTVTFDGAPPLRAEVARRPDQRARGLMQRRDLAEGAGMLFVFPERHTGGFYMFGTLIPLSIAYVDGNRVVATMEMEPCPYREPQNCPVYDPGTAYTMAVEARARFFPEHAVVSGTPVQVTGAVGKAE